MIAQQCGVITEKIKIHARGLGFNLVRVTKAQSSDRAKIRFKKWLEQGFNADMDWICRDPDKRANPRKILPEAKSIICLATNYFSNTPPRIHKDGVKIARYAWPKNYHRVIEKRLKKLEQFIRAAVSPAQCKLKSYIDTGPFLERHFAAESGLGIIGKNTCLITREFGSYVFLAEIITNLSLVPDKPIKQKFSCGACARCINSCPTGALIAPYTLDSRKCISYLTIESRGKIPRSLQPKIPPWLFGCDICQEICPHNTRARPTRNPDFALAPQLKKLTLKQLRAIKNEKEFRRILAGTSLIRTKFKGIKQNFQLSARK